MEMKQDTFISMTEDHLRKIFRREKSRDLKQSQFESEKTARIQAISAALSSVDGDHKNRLVLDLTTICAREYDFDISLF